MLESIGIFLSLLVAIFVLKKVNAKLAKAAPKIENRINEAGDRANARLDARVGKIERGLENSLNKSNQKVQAWGHRMEDKFRPKGTPARAELNQQLYGLLLAHIASEERKPQPMASQKEALPATPAPVASEADHKPGRREQKHRWTGVRDRLQVLQVRMATYETDPALAIDYPAFNDVTVPEVKSMIDALRRATHLEDASDRKADIGGSKGLLLELEDAVREYDSAIDVAERAARRLRWSHLPTQDRKDLEQIKALLAHAESTGNTDEARHSYYAQLQRVVRKLNDRHGAPVVPVVAVTQIEARARLELGR